MADHLLLRIALDRDSHRPESVRDTARLVRARFQVVHEIEQALVVLCSRFLGDQRP